METASTDQTHRTPVPAAGALPVLTVAGTPEQIVSKLDQAARRGRLAGFEPGRNGALFTASAFGHPFEGDLVASVAGHPSEANTTLRFSTRLRPKLPWIFAIILLVSIWPGAPVTKSLLASLAPSWHWLWSTTYWWYLPLSIIGAPWALWSALKRSRKEVTASAVEMVAKVEKELGATRTAPPA